MIVNDKNYFIACGLLLRDIGPKINFLLPCQSIDDRCPIYILLFSIIIWTSKMILNGTDRKWNKISDRHLWNKYDVHVYRPMNAFCRRPTVD